MLLKILYGLILLDILVVIHEFGHFIAAKISHVTVTAFSIGMGPVLIHKEINNIDWRLSLFPVGGYCALKGESDFQKAVEENLSEIKGDPDSFYGCSPWKSFFIGLAGPFANFLFAVLSFFLIALIGYSYWSAGTKITLADEVYPLIHSAARDAGLLSGDTILSIDSTEVNDFSEIAEYVMVRGDEDLSFKILRNDEILTFIVHSDFDKETGSGKIGIISDKDSVIQRHSKTYSFFPALKHGFCETVKYIYLTFKGIRSIFKGVKIENAVSGPARVTTILGDTAKTGFSINFKTGIVSILQLLGLISVSLFIMNLLPVPVLDGCIVLFAFIEGIFKIRIHPKIRYYGQYAGIFLLCILFAISLFSDFSYFIGLKK